ncbi:LuxR C-terminal-related transcriptional regulator, partial [uncultured Muribaculum sp.]
TKYVNLVDSLDMDMFDRDPVAASYLEFLKIVLDYEHSGALSLSRLSNTAHSLRKVSNDLEVKRQERDDALESAYDLSRSNYELTIRHQHLWLFIILIMLAGVIIVAVIVFVAHRRRQKLIEAEERIEALEQLAMAATKPSPDDKQALLKKTLLLQIDIIRAFAEAPTAHNQEALKKISNAGNSDSETDALVNWSELYPVIDELYNNFHANLLNDYPGLLSEREIQILCLLRAGFSTKEIGVLIQQTSNSVYVSKTSIRKKLRLLPKEDFITFLATRKPSSGKA